MYCVCDLLLRCFEIVYLVYVFWCFGFFWWWVVDLVLDFV